MLVDVGIAGKADMLVAPSAKMSISWLQLLPFLASPLETCSRSVCLHTRTSKTAGHIAKQRFHAS